MLELARREYANLVTSGAQLLLVIIGIYLQTVKGWVYCFSAIALVSVFTWLSSLTRLRTLRETPTSKIASAAQGYVELVGRGQQFGDTPMLSELSRLPCLWCRYKIEKRVKRGEWETEDSGETIESFILRDESGECMVDPEFAEISTQHFEKWQDEDRRYTEWKLLQHDLIYVLGQFRTIGGSTVEFDTREELNVLLTEWKSDMPKLLEQFDLDNDGKLDEKEWFLVTQAAKREVRKMINEAQAQSDMNIVNKPPDGKFFLISNLPREKLFRRYLFWSCAHLIIFFGSLAGMGWVLQHRLTIGVT